MQNTGTGWPRRAEDVLIGDLRTDVDRLAEATALLREQLDAVLAVVPLPTPSAADDPYPAPPEQAPRGPRGLGRLISRDS